MTSSEVNICIFSASKTLPTPQLNFTDINARTVKSNDRWFNCRSLLILGRKILLYMTVDAFIDIGIKQILEVNYVSIPII